MFHLESVVDRVKRYWDGERELFPNDIDVVTGGFPCQDFSVAGKRKGFSSQKGHDGNKLEEATEENRGKLYMWMREVIDITSPKVFIAENVKGLVSRLSNFHPSSSKEVPAFWRSISSILFFLTVY